MRKSVGLEKYPRYSLRLPFSIEVADVCALVLFGFVVKF